MGGIGNPDMVRDDVGTLSFYDDVGDRAEHRRSTDTHGICRIRNVYNYQACPPFADLKADGHDFTRDQVARLSHIARVSPVCITK